MASTTTNMGLVSWDNANDFFNFSELVANWEALDDHDHTTGKGVAIPAGGLAANAVTATNIASNAVTTAKILDGNVTAAKLASGAIGGAALGTVPAVRALRTANLSVNNTTETSVTLTAADSFDTDTMHDPGSNSERVVFTTGGIYLITAWVQFAANTTGDRYALLRTNASATLAATSSQALQTGTTDVSVSSLYNASAAEYVDIRAWQSSGGALNVSAAALTAVLVGKP